MVRLCHVCNCAMDSVKNVQVTIFQVFVKSSVLANAEYCLVLSVQVIPMEGYTESKLNNTVAGADIEGRFEILEFFQRIASIVLHFCS